MTSFSNHKLPLATALTFATLALPVHAYDNECKTPKSNYAQVQCTSDKSYFIAYDGNYKPQAVLNQQGNAVASLKNYDDVDAWHWEDGLFAVLKNNKVGYMNTKGKLVIPTVYDIMRDPDDKYDETWSEPLSEGRILVSKGGKFGIIDINHKVIFPFSNKYQTIESFSDGMAPVMSKSSKWGFINKDGKEVIAPQYDGIDGNFSGPYGFSEGLAGMKKGNKWGFITKTGKVAIPFTYDEIRPFSEGLAGVLKGNQWGFIDGANKTIIPFKYADSNVGRYSVNYMGATYFNFYDGVAEVATINDNTICINKSDKKVTCR